MHKQLSPIEIIIHRILAQFRTCESIYDIGISSIRCVLVGLRKLGLNTSVEDTICGEYAYRKLKRYEKNDCYDFDNIRLPKPELSTDIFILYCTIRDILSAYLYNNDKYNKEFVEKWDTCSNEGVYCYQDEFVDLTIKTGDIVLDLGAWFGDFSAYVAVKGGICYAFEPSSSNREYLEKTVALNSDAQGKIIIVPYGVGASTSVKSLSSFPGGGQKSDSTFVVDLDSGGEAITVVSLDDWIDKEKVHVDFIKADIEGFERHMLKGATRLLQKQQPILSLCTYHLPDDSKVMQELILKANPNYKIIQRRMKLLAYVPK